MYVKIENANDTTKVFFSESRWHLGDNYIKYKPQSAEMSNLILHPIGDNGYTHGGILNSPPEPIKPEEVDKLWDVLPERK